MPKNIQMGLNSLRCALNNLGTNTWALVASLWELIVAIGYEKEVTPYLNIGYDYVCTCNLDFNGLKWFFNISPELAAINSMCSEKGNNEKVAGERKKERLTKERTAANAVEIKLIAQDRVEV